MRCQRTHRLASNGYCDGMDVHSPDTRSLNMSRIRSKNTKPEMVVRRWLWTKGYRYRLHDKTLPGKPDIVFKGRKKAILVHGCFFHMHDCKLFKWPATRPEFWRKKIESNVIRDKRNLAKLHELGWKTLIVWECETRKAGHAQMTETIRRFLEDESATRSIQCKPYFSCGDVERWDLRFWVASSCRVRWTSGPSPYVSPFFPRIS